MGPPGSNAAPCLPHGTVLVILISFILWIVLQDQTMIREATAVSFRQNLGDMLNQVQYRHDSIVIKRDGKARGRLGGCPPV